MQSRTKKEPGPQDKPLSFEELDLLLPLRAWCHRWPGRSSSRPLNVATLYRWSLHGRHGVRLRTRCVPGSGRCATARDVLAFVCSFDSASQTAPVKKARAKTCSALVRHGLGRHQREAEEADPT